MFGYGFSTEVRCSEPVLALVGEAVVAVIVTGVVVIAVAVVAVMWKGLLLELGPLTITGIPPVAVAVGDGLAGRRRR